MADKILEIVKTLLHIEGAEFDNILKVYIAEVTQRILNFCNISELPEQLTYTAARMVVTLYQLDSGEEEAAGKVKKITEDDMTVEYSELSAQAKSELEALIVDVKPELYQYRKVGF